MKIIVSHDVDHLYGKDHYKDLIYPKLWVRSTLQLFRGDFGIKEWANRIGTTFKTERNNIDALMAFDKAHGVESSFFFGMRKGYGMHYCREDAIAFIKRVEDHGFDVGVHGIDFETPSLMESEYEAFKSIVGRNNFGIRMHYVHYNEETFDKLNNCGYLFDTTEFNKEEGHLFKDPYKVKNMWEFPLAIMDGYLPLEIERKKTETLKLVEEAEKKGIQYLTLLFHDYEFCDGYATERDWYIWAIEMLAERYEFISYPNAIKELEEGAHGN